MRPTSNARNERRQASPGRRPSRRLRSRWLKPRLTVAMILQWADEFRRRKRRWPHHFDGRISRAGEDTWARVNSALARGDRGLPGRSSLARLLFVHRGVRSPRNVPALSDEKIVKWAQRHYERLGNWPTEASGPILDADGETWAAVDLALRRGRRGLPGGLSLARLLDACGLRTNPQGRPPFTEQQILALADTHFKNRSEWPSKGSGAVDGLPGETWEAIDRAFRRGLRGLSGGRSLVSFLEKHRSILGGRKRRRRRIQEEERLRTEEIVAWGKAYFQREGIYPNRNSGAVAEVPRLTWGAIDSALKRGNRGLSGRSSLAKLFGDRRRSVRRR